MGLSFGGCGAVANCQDRLVLLILQDRYLHVQTRELMSLGLPLYTQCYTPSKSRSQTIQARICQ